jgi:hypothetical protein
VVGRYDPLHPAILRNVVTLASTSQLPVGLALAGVPEPWFRIALRTASDAHIRLAAFEGGQFLHNPFYTAETTAYGPALSITGGPPYMSWTGTNAAQNVNVSRANI